MTTNFTTTNTLSPLTARQLPALAANGSVAQTAPPQESLPAPAVSAANITVHPNDAFERAMNQPSLQIGPGSTQLMFTLLHPIQTMQLRSNVPELPGEPKMARIAMYQSLFQSLDHQGRSNLQSLLKRGILNDNRSDDKHSTLFHLYAMMTTQRAPGFVGANLVNETVRILNRPYYITQKFDKLSDSAVKQVLDARNHFDQYLNRAGEMPPMKQLTWDDLNVTTSAECVPSSVMYSMADQHPAELTRELVQLTSPMQGFYRKVTLTDVSPDKPEDAYKLLEKHQIHYSVAGQNQIWIKVELPAAGLIRAVDSNHHAPVNNVRTGVEAAYQSALTFLATRSYDPATDYRDSETPGVPSKGLTEAEKSLLECLVMGNGGVASITYQVVSGKQNPAPGEEGQPFLYGYTRTFEQTAGDIIKALRMGKFVIIGITDTDPNGAINSGHEITITSAFVDPQDKQLKFYVIDSDDDIDRPVVRTARELIPKIHHAGMPWSLVKEIRNEVEATQGYYFTTDQNDLKRYDTLSHVSERLPQEAVTSPIVTPVSELTPQEAYDDPTPKIDPNNVHTDWEPITALDNQALQRLNELDRQQKIAQLKALQNQNKPTQSVRQ